MAVRPATAQIPDLLARMTLAEKLGQLTILSAAFAVTGPTVTANLDADIRAARVGSVFNLWGRAAVRDAQRLAVEETRLGIPLFFAFDILHGFRTIVPIPLAEAGAFDPGALARTARALAAREAVDAGLDLTFAPMLDVTRDPRWGRIAESPGEDPWLAARFAEAKVSGFQGVGLSGLAATAKHFVAYGASAAGRDYAEVDVSDRALAELYLPPFRAAVDAGAAAIMPAFTDIAGVPMTANRALLTGLLRDEWGFDGVVISDYTAINELVAHGVAADIPEAAALALNAGVDIDMMSRAYLTGLPQALDRGLVAMDEPSTPPSPASSPSSTASASSTTPTAAAPAPSPTPTTRRPRAPPRRRRPDRRPLDRPPDQRRHPAARPGPRPPRADRPARRRPGRDARPLGRRRPPRRGDRRARRPARRPARRRASPTSQGVPIEADAPDSIAEAVAAAARADTVILCLGEAAWMSGEAASRARIDLPGRQAELAAAVLATGTPTVVLIFSGRPLAMPEVFEQAAASLACWFPGTGAGTAVARLLTGEDSPSAGLAVTWPRDAGQIPIAYSARPGGRPEAPGNKYTSKYLDLPNTPQFPFGHGLGYTDFTLTDPTVEAAPDRRRRRHHPHHQHRHPHRLRPAPRLHRRPRRQRLAPDPRAPRLRPRPPRPRCVAATSASASTAAPSPSPAPTSARSSSPAPTRSTSASPPTPPPCAAPASPSNEPRDALNLRCRQVNARTIAGDYNDTANRTGDSRALRPLTPRPGMRSCPEGES